MFYTPSYSKKDILIVIEINHKEEFSATLRPVLNWYKKMKANIFRI